MKKSRRLLLLLAPLLAGVLYMRSLASWRPRVVFRGAGSIIHLEFSKDGKTLIVRQFPGSSGTPQLTALDTARRFIPHWVYEEEYPLARPPLFLNDKRIFVGNGRVIDARSGEKLFKWGSLTEAVISPDGRWIATKGYTFDTKPFENRSVIPGNTISLQEFSPVTFRPTSRPTRIINTNHGFQDSYAFSPDGRTFAASVMIIKDKNYESHLDFYDVKTWKRTASWPELKGKGGFSPSSLQWSRNGRYLLSQVQLFGNKSAVQLSLWRVSDGKRLSTCTELCQVFPSGMDGFLLPTQFEVENDGRVLRFTVDEPIRLSDTTNLNAGFKNLLTLPSEKIKSATLSPDGAYLIAGTQSGKVLWQRVK